ncbi:hypothetical protein COCNU_scaffold003633G000030 [Cocos nucifera]|nr:hypothetical protein [Cocos nucifera]
MVNHLKSKALKAQEDLQAKVNHLWDKKTVEVDHLLKQKVVEVGGLQEVLRKEEHTSVGLKATFALEEERRKKAKVKIAELKDQTSRQISKAKIRAMEEFKVFSQMRDLNVAFSQEAFQKGYELYEGRVVSKFFELNLDFLYEEATDPSAIAADLPPDEFASTAPPSSSILRSLH